MARIYPAGQYAKRERIKSFAQKLRAKGHEVTARWLNETLSPTVSMADVPEDDLRSFAVSDLRDIEDADILTLHAEPHDKQPPRGGRHFECGYAYALGKLILVIGDRENIFHLAPGVVVVPDEDSALEVLGRIAGVGR